MISRSGIESQREIVSRSCLNHRDNFFGNPRPMFDSSKTPYQGILHSTTPSATGAVPVQVSAGQLVARGEERIGSTTTMPMSERTPSTMIFFVSGNSTEFYVWTAKTTDIGASV